MGNSRRCKKEKEYSAATTFVFHDFFFSLLMGKWASNKSFCVIGSFLIAHCKLFFLTQTFYAVHVRQPQFEFWFCCCDSTQSASTSFSRVVTRLEIFLTEKISILLFVSLRSLNFQLVDRRKKKSIFSATKSVDWNTRSSPRPRTCAVSTQTRLPLLLFCCCWVAGVSAVFFSPKSFSFLFLAHFSCHKSDEQNDANLLQRTQELR